MRNNFEADPEKYKQLSQPFESAEEAERVANAFLNAVRKLREEYRIAELVIQFQVYLKEGEEVQALIGGGGWGNQLYQANLARRAADREFEHLGLVLELLVKAMPKAQAALITDPKADE